MANETFTPALVWVGVEIGLTTLDLQTGRRTAVQLRQKLQYRAGPKEGQVEMTPWSVALPEQIRDLAAKLLQKAEEADKTPPLPATYQ